jgi:16S rRNA (guanine(1405)-N(7))-methyltransferase
MSEQLKKLVQQVQEGAKYRFIHKDLVENIARNEITKGRSWKGTVKAVRNKLHQVGGAYQPLGIDYEQLTSELKSLPHDMQTPEAKRFFIQTMGLHASTRERLLILDQFFHETLAPLAPIHSVLDVACGLNPLALAWIPLSESVEITVCDIYTDQMEFLNAYFEHFHINGKATCCDLTQQIPSEKAQIGFVLKTIPCLEQIDKSIGSKIIQNLQCENLLVSFPSQSLTGKQKGMRQFYSEHFQTLLKDTNLKSTTFSFQNEQAFLIQK